MVLSHSFFDIEIISKHKLMMYSYTMTKKSSKQKGSAHIIIIVILVIALLGTLGFIFWQNISSKDEGSISTKTSSDTEVQETPKSSAYSLSDAVQGINATLKGNVCSGKAQVKEDDFVQVKDTDSFEYRGGKTIINDQFTYAYVQYGCGSQGSIALMKRGQVDWKIVSEDVRIYPRCETIAGENFPSAIVDKCYDTNTSTEPRDIVSS
jgi:hypothetical protein